MSPRLKRENKLEYGRKLVLDGATFKEAAKRSGTSTATLYRSCKANGIKSRNVQGRKPDPRWHKLDWRKTNNELAEEMGVTRERVRQVRLREKERALSMMDAIELAH